MLLKRRCPHTGVINFFAKTEPLLALGSVVETGTKARYAWRCYVGQETCGIVADAALAEDHLKRAIAKREPHLRG